MRTRGSPGLLVVERHVGHQVLDDREGAQRRHRDDLVLGEGAHARHAHQPRPPVDLGAARPALAGLAVPPHREVRGLRRLQAVDDVEHDLAFVDLDGEVLEVAVGAVTAPHLETCVVAHQAFPSGRIASSSSVMYLLSSSRSNNESSSGGITGSGCFSTATPSPSGRQTRLTLRHSVAHRREVVAGVAAAGLLADQCRAGDALRDDEHVVEVEREVPAGVEHLVAHDADALGAGLELLEAGRAPAPSPRACG